jgi:hypothetical protein
LRYLPAAVALGHQAAAADAGLTPRGVAHEPAGSAVGGIAKQIDLAVARVVVAAGPAGFAFSNAHALVAARNDGAVGATVEEPVTVDAASSAVSWIGPDIDALDAHDAAAWAEDLAGSAVVGVVARKSG